MRYTVTFSPRANSCIVLSVVVMCEKGHAVTKARAKLKAEGVIIPAFWVGVPTEHTFQGFYQVAETAVVSAS